MGVLTDYKNFCSKFFSVIKEKDGLVQWPSVSSTSLNETQSGEEESEIEKALAEKHYQTRILALEEEILILKKEREKNRLPGKKKTRNVKIQLRPHMLDKALNITAPKSQ